MENGQPNGNSNGPLYGFPDGKLNRLLGGLPDGTLNGLLVEGRKGGPRMGSPDGLPKEGRNKGRKEGKKTPGSTPELSPVYPPASRLREWGVACGSSARWLEGRKLCNNSDTSILIDHVCF